MGSCMSLFVTAKPRPCYGRNISWAILGILLVEALEVWEVISAIAGTLSIGCFPRPTRLVNSSAPPMGKRK